MYIENDLKHFGINEEETKDGQLFRCKNSYFFREKTGVNQAMEACERISGSVAKKARIIIDYDADYPNIITRVISQ